jgi:hypothetical protein
MNAVSRGLRGIILCFAIQLYAMIQYFKPSLRSHPR